MGSRYTTQSASGYNSSPPADDGSQSASNLITWAGIKTKVGDPVKNLADAMNTALVTAFDYSTRQITASDSVAASDHMKVVEIAPTVTVAVTVTLPDAATMTSNFRVWVRNSSAVAATVARATGGDTIDGTAANITLQSGQACLFGTTASADGYLTLAAFPLDIQRLTADTAPTVSDVIGTYDDSAALHKKVSLSNFLKIINGLTTDSSPDRSADYVATYDASASAPKKVLLSSLGGITLSTEQATTSGTSIDFTSIPAGTKRITVMFKGVSTNGTSLYLIQIGDAGGIENSGYSSATSEIAGGVSSSNSTAGFVIGADAATYTVHGSVTLCLENEAAFSWTASGVLAASDSAVTFTTAGSKSLTAALDRVRITTVNGTDAFDAGAVNISYE